MAERPSDDWFRENGWTEFNEVWVRDYGDMTFSYVKSTSTLGYRSVFCIPEWCHKAYHSKNPVALHNAWLKEEKRRNTPLDPDGWQHFDGCSVHVEGGYRVTQTQTGARWNAWKSPHTNFDCLPSKEIAIAACNQHARENGVKSC